MKHLWLLLVFGISCFDSARGFWCMQGLNATILGVPLYAWNKVYCSLDSCFMQEMTFPFFDTGYEVGVQLGGCIPSGSEDLITCEKLFANNTDIRLVRILKLMPALDQLFSDLNRDFGSIRRLESYRQLFSNGHGIEPFVKGCFTLLGNLGVNTEIASPLRPKMVEFIDAVLPAKSRRNNVTDVIVKDFMDALRPVIDEYKDEYKSEMPDIVWKFALYVNASYHLGQQGDCFHNFYVSRRYRTFKEMQDCERRFKEMLPRVNAQAIDVAVDFQFAYSEEFNFDYLDLYEEIRKAFPDFDSFIRIWKLLDRDDMKQFYKDCFRYAHMTTGYGNVFFAQINTAFNRTLDRVQSKFQNFLQDLRSRLAPKTCKAMICPSSRTGSCNDPKTVTMTPATTTGENRHSTTTGDNRHPTATGDNRHPTATGDNRHSTTTGDNGHSTTGHATVFWPNVLLNIASILFLRLIIWA